VRYYLVTFTIDGEHLSVWVAAADFAAALEKGWSNFCASYGRIAESVVQQVTIVPEPEPGKEKNEQPT